MSTVDAVWVMDRVSFTCHIRLIKHGWNLFVGRDVRWPSPSIRDFLFFSSPPPESVLML